MAAHIEEGYLQAERGELIDGDQARHDIAVMNGRWRKERLSRSRQIGSLRQTARVPDAAAPTAQSELFPRSNP